jgi:hypothetical protein
VRHATPLILGTALVLSFAAPAARAEDDGTRERIAKSFTLASGSRIELSMIPGSVEIDATAGRSADVDVVRTAPSRADLDCGSVVIEQAGSTLTIRSRDNCTNVRGEWTVRLSVPRDVDLSLRNIAGHVRIASTDGMVRLESIAGHVEASGLRDARMSSLAHGLELTVVDLGHQGIRVSSVVGSVDLQVGSRLDAEVITRSVNGRVESDVPGLRITETDETNQRAVLGSGRGRIEIDSVVGAVRIHG